MLTDICHGFNYSTIKMLPSGYLACDSLQIRAKFLRQFSNCEAVRSKADEVKPWSIGNHMRRRIFYLDKIEQAHFVKNTSNVLIPLINVK